MKPKILIMGLCLFFISACSQNKESMKSAQEITTATVTKDTIERKVLFTGNIDAKSAVQVFPRAKGKISQKNLKEGDPVKKGQAILTADRDEIGFKFKPMPIDSPIDGLVGSILVDVGTNVDLADPVAVVVQPGDMRLKLEIPEKYLSVIQPGTKVSLEIDSLNNEVFEGSIVTSSPVIDQKTRTAKIEILIPNPDKKLKHGMFGKIYIVVEKHDNAIVVPYSAISWEGDKQFTYKIVDDIASRTEITVGLRNDTHVEILNGLSENDVVATGNLIDLKDGEAVKIISEKQ